jgi:hypothetical protein
MCDVVCRVKAARWIHTEPRPLPRRRVRADPGHRAAGFRRCDRLPRSGQADHAGLADATARQRPRPGHGGGGSGCRGRHRVAQLRLSIRDRSSAGGPADHCAPGARSPQSAVAWAVHLSFGLVSGRSSAPAPLRAADRPEPTGAQPGPASTGVSMLCVQLYAQDGENYGR